MKELGPDGVPALTDGRVSVVVYIRADPETFFQYQSGKPQPSVTAKYRIVNSKDFLGRYVDAINQGPPIWLDPGELEDENGDRFTVRKPSVFPEEGSTLVPAMLSLDNFFTEPKELVLYERETPLSLLLNEFLNAHPQGGFVLFRDWVIKQYDGEWLEHSSEILWRLADSTEFRKSVSQVKTQLGDMKRRQLELLGK